MHAKELQSCGKTSAPLCSYEFQKKKIMLTSDFFLLCRL